MIKKRSEVHGKGRCEINKQMHVEVKREGER